MSSDFLDHPFRPNLRLASCIDPQKRGSAHPEQAHVAPNKPETSCLLPARLIHRWRQSDGQTVAPRDLHRLADPPHLQASEYEGQFEKVYGVNTQGVAGVYTRSHFC